MTALLAETIVEGAHAICEDCAVACPVGDGYLLAVADGAGGLGGGRRAAELVVASVTRAVAAGGQLDLMALVASCDHEIHRDRAAGEATAVLALITPQGISGASVGDSEAWLIQDGAVVDLSRNQRRKPRVGTGAAMPVPFASGPLKTGVLLLGSDGLFKYAARAQLLAAATAPLADLVSLVRLPNRTLQDDVAIVRCRGRD